MWIFTTRGFVSAVQHKDDPQTMVVRARARQHLVALFPQEDIISLTLADYPHRVHIPKTAFVDWMTEQAQAIDYPDFKSELPNGRYHDTCSQIWSVAHNLQR